MIELTKANQRALSALRQSSSSSFSPILSKLDTSPFDAEPACANCPLARWIATSAILVVFCQMRHETLSTPVLACDGQQLALASLDQKEE